MLPTIYELLSVFFSLVALMFSAYCVHFVRKKNSRSVSLREIAVLSTEVTQLQDAYESILKSHRKLRSRIGMRDVRDRRKQNSDGAPDPNTDPEGWKRHMRLKLSMEGKK